MGVDNNFRTENLSAMIFIFCGKNTFRNKSIRYFTMQILETRKKLLIKILNSVPRQRNFYDNSVQVMSL